MALVIGGHQGSGKSLIRKALMPHPNIVITDDFGNFCNIGRSYRKYVRGLELKWRYPKRRSPLSQAFVVRYLGLIWLRSFWKRGVAASDIETVLRQMFPYALVVGDAFSTYGRHLDETLGIPHLKHVVVYRDCRDVAAAMARRLMNPRSTQRRDARHIRWIQKIATAEQVAYRWLNYVQIMQKHRARLYIIRYEDLVADPEAVLAPFGRWLGVDPSEFKYDFIHSSRIGEYRQFLSGQDTATILAIAGPAMKQLGYI